MSNKNKNLHKAKKEKNDEFYTLLSDIEKEMVWYKDFFKDKVVYCNCDDARESNFFKYFSENFELLGLKKLITTGYIPGGHGVVLEYSGDKNGDFIVSDDEILTQELAGDGDFRSPECIEFLKQADVVVTNPPFSLFREYVAQLMTYGKKFIILGNMNAVSDKCIFPYIKNNQLWFGYAFNQTLEFMLPDSYSKYDHLNSNGRKIGKVPSITWFTNIENTRRNTPLTLFKKYNSVDYPKYDNYDAIEVSKVEEIPLDWDGVMGVPITFLGKYCPEQFEIIWRSHDIDYAKNKCDFYNEPTEEECEKYKEKDSCWRKQIPYIVDSSGIAHCVYNRIFIKRKS